MFFATTAAARDDECLQSSLSSPRESSSILLVCNYQDDLCTWYPTAPNRVGQRDHI
jgi:hypothetical protein